MIQVYKSHIKDLLKPIDEPSRHLTVGTDRSGCPFVKGATVVKQPNFYKLDYNEKDGYVYSSTGCKDVIKVFNRGVENRLMRSTDVNETSSSVSRASTLRIHSIIIIIIVRV